jgi:hypothetical protein
MKRIFVMAAAASLASTAAMAQSSGSGGGSFANAYLIPVIVCSVTANATTASSCATQAGGPKVLYGNIKVPSASNKNVILMGSLETSILTDTTVASLGGTKSTSSAFGSIIVTPQIYQCLDAYCNTVSSTPAAPIVPSKVTFDERLQTLSASLLGLGCTANTTTGVITCTSPETIELLLSTTSAHSFNFLVNGALSSGVYQVQLGVQVSGTATTSATLSSGASVQVGVGAGSLIEEILQSQTPFTSVTACNTTGATSGTAVVGCGP